MPSSNFKMLWDDSKPFTSLKMIDVKYSTSLKITPNFKNSKSIESLIFRGCERLLKVHPSISELTGLYFLNLRECINVKLSAESLGQLSALGHLYLGRCSNLRQLPKQLGDMKWLKKLDASHTAIEELPDSITQLVNLETLDLEGCKKLKKLPEQIGNMVGLRTFGASYTAIEQLPDSFVGLVNLERMDLRFCENLRNLPNSIWKLKLLKILDLEWCSKLERLPDELEKMQCLEELYASETAIGEVPDSIGLLSRLRVLDLAYCVKLKYLPDCVWNLSSLKELNFGGTDIDGIKMPAIVKGRKLVTLALKCNVRVWLPMILSFSSLKRLVLSGGGESLSSTKPISLSKLYSLQHLELNDCTSLGSSFPELPLSLTHLILTYNTTLVHLPDLSSLKKLKKLQIFHFFSLESLPPLPPNLQSLSVYNCTSLRHLSDMPMLKELRELQLGRCSKRNSVGSEKSFLQVIDVRKHFLPFYKVEVPKIAEWFSYKSTGHTVSFDMPTLSPDKFLGLALSVLFTTKGSNGYFSMKADVTNKTNGTTKFCVIPVSDPTTGDEEHYVVKCISGDEIPIRSGDNIKILLRRPLYWFDGRGELSLEGVKIEMFAAYVITRTISTPDFPSVFNNLIN